MWIFTVLDVWLHKVHTVTMLEGVLTSVVSDYLPVPVWTAVLACVCLVWILFDTRKLEKYKVSEQDNIIGFKLKIAYSVFQKKNQANGHSLIT